MADNIQTEMKTAMIYDLLSQEGRLDNAQMQNLQELLNDMGHSVGTADSFMGKNTARGIMSFLKEPEHRQFAIQISDDLEKRLHKYGQGESIERLQTQANLGEEAYAAITNDINALLKEEGLSENSVISLQERLEEVGYELGNIDGDFGKKTSKALAEYLEDNPQELLNTDPSILLKMMQKGQAGALREIAADVPEFQERIKQQLVDLGITNDPDSLRTELDHNALIDLQTLLSIGGHNPGGIDGIVGSKTVNATKRFLSENPIVSAAPETSLRPELRPDDLVPIPPEKPENTAPEDTVERPRPNYGEIAADGFTRVYEGDNGYGVSNLAVERAWARITGNEVDQDLLRDHKDTPSVTEANARPLVVIDLGHGSDINSNDKIDPGAVSAHVDGLSEVSVVDPVSQEMAKQLHQMGYDVAFTRNPGEQLRVEGTHGQTLRVRPDFAHELANEVDANGVIFVSMHANSFAKESANGTRLYIDVDGARVTNNASSNLADSISETFSISAKQTAVKQVGDLSVIDKFEDGLTGQDGMSAGILVELGFLSNKNDAAALAEMQANPAKAASQIVEGINGYVVDKRPELAQQPQRDVQNNNDMNLGG